MKSKLVALHCDTLRSVDVLSEVTAAEIITHLNLSDLGMRYGEAFENSRMKIHLIPVS